MKNSNSHSFYFWFSKKLATFWKLKNELFFYLALALNLFLIFEKTRNFWKLKKIKKILTRTRASLDFKFFMKLKLTLNWTSNLKKNSWLALTQKFIKKINSHSKIKEKLRKTRVFGLKMAIFKQKTRKISGFGLKNSHLSRKNMKKLEFFLTFGSFFQNIFNSNSYFIYFRFLKKLATFRKLKNELFF